MDASRFFGWTRQSQPVPMMEDDMTAAELRLRLAEVRRQNSDYAEENRALREKLKVYGVPFDLQMPGLRMTGDTPTRVAELEQALRERDGIIATLHSQTAGLNMQLKAHEHNHNDAQGEIDGLRTRIRNLHDDNQTLEQRVRDRNQALAHQEATMAETMDQLSKQSCHQSPALQESACLQNTVKTLEAQVKAADAATKSTAITINTTLGSISEHIVGVPHSRSDWVNFCRHYGKSTPAIMLRPGELLQWTVCASESQHGDPLPPTVLSPKTNGKLSLSLLAFGLRAAVDMETENPLSRTRVLFLLNQINQQLATADIAPTAVLLDIVLTLVKYAETHYADGKGALPMTLAIILALVHSINFLHRRFGQDSLQKPGNRLRRILLGAWTQFTQILGLVTKGDEEARRLEAHHREHPSRFGEQGAFTLKSTTNRDYMVLVDFSKRKITVEFDDQ